MATHCSILAWRIPWTGERGGLQSKGHKTSDMTEATKHEAHAQDPTVRCGTYLCVVQTTCIEIFVTNLNSDCTGKYTQTMHS